MSGRSKKTTDLLAVQNLCVEYYTRGSAIRAVDEVSFTLRKGEAIGIAGESGCGKSTLALSLLRVLPPNGRIVSGSITLEGKDLIAMGEEQFRKEVRWKEISMIFQGAMNVLNPIMKVGKQITETMIVHQGISKTDAREQARKLMPLVGLSPERLDNYPHELSGGIKQRIVIALALSCNPKLILADEPTTALDAITQTQVFQTINDLRRELQVSVILVSHDIAALSAFCDRINIMYAANFVESNTVHEIVNSPLHPYTKALLSSVPTLKKEKISSIPGSAANIASPPSGCRFHPRCPYAFELCRTARPSTFSRGKEGTVACYLYK
ncbi:MAG TPA: ABC transporter ATP-binding protein [Nitrososphaerales archaeon]|nr:ABC transporter ATP-binding protein [Nitrososphaerales archaeon]